MDDIQLQLLDIRGQLASANQRLKHFIEAKGTKIPPPLSVAQRHVQESIYAMNALLANSKEGVVEYEENSTTLEFKAGLNSGVDS